MNEFRRMMQRVLKNNWAQNWITASLLLLFTGLLVSRALVSFASVLMVVPCVYHYRTINHNYLIALCFIFFPVLVSGLWSSDHQLWWNSVAVKIPLLTMMLGLVSVPLSAGRWKQIVQILILLVFTGCCWSLLQYSPAIQEAYLKAKTLPTPAEDDHIRFSWLVVTAIVLGVKMLPVEKKNTIRYIFIAVLLLQVVYLHILAAKTGLVCLYGGCFVYFLYLGIMQKKWKTGLAMLVTALVAAAVCYQTIPTLRNRIQYVAYDFSNYSKGNSMPGYGDASRWLSIKAGYAITKENPVTGVGFGDMLVEVNAWHQANHPSSLAYERFLPANEWLVYGTGSGWPGLVCFTIGLLLLLYTGTSKKGVSMVLSLTSLVPFLIDDTLEGQYGVVILAFIAFFGQQKLTEPAA